MNLVTVIVLAMFAWIMYAFIQSYRNIEKELREIRLKCVITGGVEAGPDPFERMKGQLVGGLQRIRPT